MDPLVAVGGLGGSGTRVVAEILKKSNIYIGDDLNKALDNLTFTYLFKYLDLIHNSRHIYANLDLFCKYMSNINYSISNYWNLLHPLLFNDTYSNRFKLKRIKKLFEKNNHKDKRFWGWKEPNTHQYVEYILDYFPDIKYIHVLRNGLDMAYSDNKNQLSLWGSLYNIDQNVEIQNQQLEYWVKANRRTITILDNYDEERFLITKFEDLCKDSKNSVKSIIEFLNLNISKSKFHDLIDIPKIIPSIGRYKKRGINNFREKYIKKVEEFRYEI